MGRKEPKANAVAAELDKLRGKQTDGKVNLADASFIKRALDEGASKVLEEQGYKEDVRLTDAKIALGLVICGLAALAQFYPKKYPENYWVLVFCVSFYIVATFLQNFFLGRIGGDVFFQSQIKGGSVLCLTSKMPRYSEEYELGIGRRSSVWSPKEKAAEVATTRVTEYFDTEGQLLEDRFRAFVTDLLGKFEKQPARKKQ